MSLSRQPADSRATRFADRAGPGVQLRQITIEGHPVAIHERVVTDKPFCRLLHFEREGMGVAPRLVAVAPLSGQHSEMLHDMLAALLPDHDLFLMDWSDARDVPAAAGRFAFADNIAYVIEFLQTLGSDIHLLGLCQSAIPALAAAGILAQAGDAAGPCSLVLISGTIDPRINPTRIGRLAAQRSLDWFERHAIRTVPEPHPGQGRRVYPAFAQRMALFAYLLRHLSTGGELLEKVLADDGQDAARFPFLASYFRVMDLTAEFFLDTIRCVFQEFALPRGCLRWRGAPIDLAAITRTALMTIEGEFDDVSGVGQTRIAHDLCPNIPGHRREHHVQRRVGHFGTFYGRAWRTEILPRVRRFIRGAA
jgi:poly(3-hydroxybutyrate) depolymerase